MAGHGQGHCPLTLRHPRQLERKPAAFVARSGSISLMLVASIASAGTAIYLSPIRSAPPMGYPLRVLNHANVQRRHPHPPSQARQLFSYTNVSALTTMIFPTVTS